LKSSIDPKWLRSTRPLIYLMFVLAILSLTTMKQKPVLYIIGDSTVKNGDGKKANQQQGWGSFLDTFFDTTKITISNQAIGGRSSRTFLTDGRWGKIIKDLKPGDFVLMQFGHNDDWPLDDTARARGTIKGIGEESKEIYNPIKKQKEVVYTYGWYMRKYANETKEKGATPIICSPVPRHNWKEGKVVRNDQSYGLWAKQVAEQTKSHFIDLNSMIAIEYERLDSSKVSTFFPADHTHTNMEGAILNAGKVVEGIKSLKKCSLKKCLRQSKP
jgi:rhamnogalacturonan acetylesterase